MSDLVADTHALIWYLTDSSRLSEAATEAFEQALDSDSKIYISAITLIEIIYLSEKERIPSSALDKLLETLRRNDSFLQIMPVRLETALTLRNIPRAEIPDMPDRIIAATAKQLGVPLITRDRAIQAADLETIW